METKVILNQLVSKLKFSSSIKSFQEGSHRIPPALDWRVVSQEHPLLKIEVRVNGVETLLLVLDCTNYDYDPPYIRYEYITGEEIPWSVVKSMVATYPGRKLNQPVMLNDVILYPDGEGLVCRVGNESYHQLHPESNWREIRTLNEGRLDFIIDSSIRLFDVDRLSAFGKRL